jgi:hypothetical protein
MRSLNLNSFQVLQAQTIDDQKAATDELIQMYDALPADTPPSIRNALATLINDSLAQVDPTSNFFLIVQQSETSLYFYLDLVAREPIVGKLKFIFLILYITRSLLQQLQTLKLFLRTLVRS